MAIARLVVLSLSLYAAGAGAQAIDFATPGGPDRTCPKYRSLDPAKLRGDAERAAFAICNSIDLVREAASRFRSYQSQGERNDNALVSDLRSRLERINERIRASRLALEGIRGPGPYFTARPGDWAIDWDGDGAISTFEKYLLWVPRRGVTAFQPAHGYASPEAYYEQQFASPRIKVDRADAYWAAAYMQFAETLLNTVLAYEVDLSQGVQLLLRDAGRITRGAYQNLLGGLRASALLRQSLLKETDDDDEWIPNPKQVRTSFPLLMDPQTFATWGELLGHMEKLFRGQTLLGGTIESQEFRNVRDLSGGACPPGQGIDVHSLFTDPIREPSAPDALQSRCAAPTARRPLTGLGAMIAASLKRNAGRTPDSFSGEWMILRHFYWVN